MTRTETEPRGLLFDLFGTLVDFDFARLETITTELGPRYATIRGLDELLGRLDPRPTVEEFYSALTKVSRSLTAHIKLTHREISSPVRFQQTLAALGVGGEEMPALAKEFTRRHMNSLASSVVCPRDRPELLRKLGTRYRLGLISNFDHEPTARYILRRFQLESLFQAIVISDGIGIRKPAAEIFERGCYGLGLRPQDCLHVGDSRSADVEGASAAGLSVVWIHDGNADPAPALTTIADVEQLPAWLSDRYCVRFGL